MYISYDTITAQHCHRWLGVLSRSTSMSASQGAFGRRCWCRSGVLQLCGWMVRWLFRVMGLMWFGYIEGLFVRLFCCRKPAVNVETRSSYLEAFFCTSHENLKGEQFAFQRHIVEGWGRNYFKFAVKEANYSCDSTRMSNSLRTYLENTVQCPCFGNSGIVLEDKLMEIDSPSRKIPKIISRTLELTAARCFLFRVHSSNRTLKEFWRIKNPPSIPTSLTSWKLKMFRSTPRPPR